MGEDLLQLVDQHTAMFDVLRLRDFTSSNEPGRGCMSPNL
jgi:hypothetical protein